MSDSFSLDDSVTPGDLPDTMSRTRERTNELGASIRQFSTSMTRAFAQSVASGKQFDDVVKSLVLNLSKLSVQSAFRPLADNVAGDFVGGLAGALQGTAGGSGAMAFADAGIGASGSALAASSAAASPSNITVHIVTPDADSFRRSEAYLTGQIARAVARGQRNL